MVSVVHFRVKKKRFPQGTPETDAQLLTPMVTLAVSFPPPQEPLRRENNETRVTRAVLKKWMFALCLTLAFCACNPGPTKTFAGFTFGGGGNTFSAEPCELKLQDGSGLLTAGKSGQPESLNLHWDHDSSGSPESYLGKKLELTKASITVESKGGTAELKSGHIVLQARDGDIAHGSFDVTGKLEDGREVSIVGSFTASVP